MERKTLQSSDNIEFEFSWGWRAVWPQVWYFCEQRTNNWWFWSVSKKRKKSFPMKICLRWHDRTRPDTTSTTKKQQKTCVKEFQVELPLHRHFLMTREVRCNLWLSGPDIRRSLLLSVVPDYCQLDFIHLPHPSLSFSHSKTHLSNFYRAMNSAPATKESCRVFVKMRRALPE